MANTYDHDVHSRDFFERTNHVWAKAHRNFLLTEVLTSGALKAMDWVKFAGAQYPIIDDATVFHPTFLMGDPILDRRTGRSRSRGR